MTRSWLRRSVRISAACICLGSAAAAVAGEMVPPSRGDTESSRAPIRTILELFTSQGCSSCPAADALLKAYADDPSVVALSMPVDYWDYLGWKDTFASPRNTERQRSYAKARGDGAIYTPQMVVNGALHVNGANKPDIDSAIDLTTKNTALPHVPIRIWQEQGTLNIQVGGAEPGREAREATIWLALVQPMGTADVERGENAGRKLSYSNIVRELTPVGLWKGSPILIQIPRAAVMQASTQKSVVFVQEGKAGPILGAAWAGLW